MPYQLDLTDEALNSLKKLDKPVARRIMKKLRWLADNAETVQHVGLTGQLNGFYKLRIGDYRAIYDLDKQGRLILVMVVGHRREIYDE